MLRTGGAIHTSKLRAKRKRARVVTLVLSLVVLLCLVGGLVGLSYIPQITIHTVDVHGLSTIPEEEARAVIEEILQDTYFFLFPKRNIFVYPQHELEKTLLSLFPKLKSAHAVFEDFTRISLSFEERSPAALWCGVEKGEDPCYFLDKDGFLYAHAPEFSGTVFVRYYGEGGGEVGTSFMTPQSFRSLSAFVTELGGMAGEPGRVEVASGDAEIFFLDGFSVRVALKDKPEKLVERLALALESAPLKGKDLGTLSYIDLRFGERVVYKFK